MHPVDAPHPVFRISHSGSLPPIKTPITPPPPPPPLHEKNKNHDPPKPLAQKYLPHRRGQLLRENGRKSKSKK
jgi:hypothetical protein